MVIIDLSFPPDTNVIIEAYLKKIFKMTKTPFSSSHNEARTIAHVSVSISLTLNINFTAMLHFDRWVSLFRHYYHNAGAGET